MHHKQSHTVCNKSQQICISKCVFTQAIQTQSKLSKGLCSAIICACFATQNVHIWSSIRSALHREGYLKPVKIHIHPSCGGQSEQLQRIVTEMGGEVAMSASKAVLMQAPSRLVTSMSRLLSKVAIEPRLADHTQRKHCHTNTHSRSQVNLPATMY